MPPMTWLGWFHTIMGVIAIITAASALYRHKIIRASDASGRAYLLITLVVAGSALAIYNQGGFGIAHILAVLTLAALACGVIMEKTHLFGSASKYFQALGYTSTLLFHMIPAITDFLRRLPIGDPFIDTLEDPLLQQFHLAFLLIFVIGLIAQFLWLKKRAGS